MFLNIVKDKLNMCGIVGFNWEDRIFLKKACESLKHRGPDQLGYYNEKNISLGHTRLSIIDLSERGKQPMTNEDDALYIIFNGEIYNFQDLRLELEKKGHKFKSNTDTEVILHAYEEWNQDCVQKFNGMFAFSIYNKKNKTVFIARDRLGVKPLFYYYKNSKFIFASEIKAILQDPTVGREINPEALDYFLTLAYIPSPYTVFKNIFQLLPGHFLIYKNNQLTIKKYWDLQFNQQESSERSLLKEMGIIMEDAVKKRMISDVPLGLFLSGGIDSSLIAFLMKQFSPDLKTFSIGFENEEFDETPYAKKIAYHLDTDHKEFFVKPDAISILPKIIYHFDQPFADPSALPTYYLSELTRGHVTVALSGDGADELFAGYRRYYAAYLNNKVRLIPGFMRNLITYFPATRKRHDPKKYIDKLFQGLSMDEEERHLFYMQHFEDNMKKEMYNNLRNTQSSKQLFQRHIYHLNSKNQLDRSQYLDIKTFLPDDILVKVDRMSMANSLEVRSPFMDYRLFEFASKLPAKLRLNKLQGKYILKKFAENKIPQEIIHRKKEGFSVPLNTWFDNELKDITQNLLLENRRDYFNKPTIQKIINNHLQRKKEYSTQLWILLNLELWHRIFIDRDKPEFNLNKLI